MKQDNTLLNLAADTWSASADFRSRRTRLKKFAYGDQWSELVSTEDGSVMTERDFLISRGKRPLTNNLIRQLVKTIVGRYRNDAKEHNIYDSSPDSIAYRNNLSELDARVLEDFVISGAAIQRVCAERRPAGSGVWIDNVQPDHFFVNPYRDPRGFDIDLIGMLHDMTLLEILNRFGDGSISTAQRLKAIFNDDNFIISSPQLGTSDRADFYTSELPNRHRVIEVWRLVPEQTHLRNRRFALEPAWRCTWLAPDGTVLASYKSPFCHKAHPFVVKLYPLTDGEIHSFVEDIIDQQRTINRMIVMIDSMMAHSAKGVLLFPTDQIAKGSSIEEVSRLWSSPDALIPISGRGNAQPTQIITNTADCGAYQLLNMEMKLLENVSGISDALLGRNSSGSSGAELYNSQVKNATIAITDLLDTFAAFTHARDILAANTLPPSNVLNKSA